MQISHILSCAAVVAFSVLTASAYAAGVTTTTSTGPAAGTSRPIAMTGNGLVTYSTSVPGFTFSSNQASGVVTFSTTNSSGVVTYGTVTIGQ